MPHLLSHEYVHVAFSPRLKLNHCPTYCLLCVLLYHSDENYSNVPHTGFCVICFFSRSKNTSEKGRGHYDNRPDSMTIGKKTNREARRWGKWTRANRTNTRDREVRSHRASGLRQGTVQQRKREIMCVDVRTSTGTCWKEQ